MACETIETCEVIGKAVIGYNFKVGCTICPKPTPFDPTARMTSNPGSVKLYKKQLQNIGVVNR